MLHVIWYAVQVLIIAIVHSNKIEVNNMKPYQSTEYLKIYFLLVLLFIFSFSIFPEIPGSDGKESDENISRGWLPFSLSLIGFKYLQIAPPDWNVYGVRINAIYGKNIDVYGLDVSPFVNVAENAGGIQISGFGANWVKKSFYGLQLNLMFNVVEQKMWGFQIGGWNQVKKTISSKLVSETFDSKTYEVISIPGYINGLQLGFILNEGGNSNGVQIGIGGNDIGGTLDRKIPGNVNGIQLGGLFNLAEGELTGIQFPSFVGNGAGKLNGIQIGIIMNTIGYRGGGIGMVRGRTLRLEDLPYTKFQPTHDMNGFQFALFANLVDDNMKGIEISTITNYVDEKATGFQFSLINISEKVSGIQIGLVNYCRRLKGLQIGLLNFNWEGTLPVFPLINFGWSF